MTALLAKFLLLRHIEPRPKQILGEIRRRGDADQRMNARGAGECGQQHDPTAHARPDQDLRAFGQLVEHGNRVLGPAADRAQGELAARRAVAEIVEAHEGATAPAAIFVEKQRLGAGHVGAKAAQEHDPGRGAGEPVVGDCCAIVTW